MYTERNVIFNIYDIYDYFLNETAIYTESRGIIGARNHFLLILVQTKLCLKLFIV